MFSAYLKRLIAPFFPSGAATAPGSPSSPHTTASPTGLLSLPTEVLESICDELFPYRTGKFTSDDTVHLAFFARTCKRFNPIATPLLYSRFIPPAKMFVCANFLATIFRRPELGEYVQELNFRFCSIGMESIELYPICFEVAASLGVDLGQHPRQHPFETLTQLIIACTPNVKVFAVLTDRFVMCRSTVRSVVNQLARKRTFFLSKLESLAVRHFCTASLPIVHYSGFVMISPRLRQLWVEPSSPLEHPWSQPSTNRYLATVRRLVLNLGNLDRDQMRRIVDACGPLTIFHHIYGTLDFERRPSVTPAEMVQILGRHAGTLTSVRLNLAWRHKDGLAEFYTSPLCYESEEIRSMKAFSRLETLELDGSCFLLPWKGDESYHENVFTQLLPSSIRYFGITVALPGTVENLRSVAMARSEFPNLRKVYMENKLLAPSLGDNVIFIWQDVTALERMMRMVGIYFKAECSMIGIAPSPSPSVTAPESGYNSPESGYASPAAPSEDSTSGSEESGGDAADADESGAVEPDVQASHVDGPDVQAPDVQAPDVEGPDEPDVDGPDAEGTDANAAPQQASTASDDDEDLYD
ncbi:hypothetical protein V8C44DRAFT_369863 [Trichoderma aethiopicum]